MDNNRDYKKTLAQQEDLNWDGDPELDSSTSVKKRKT